MNKRFIYSAATLLVIRLVSSTLLPKIQVTKIWITRQEIFNFRRLTIEQYTLKTACGVVLIRIIRAGRDVAVYYDVGSRHEREGRTGFAHL